MSSPSDEVRPTLAARPWEKIRVEATGRHSNRSPWVTSSRRSGRFRWPSVSRACRVEWKIRRALLML